MLRKLSIILLITMLGSLAIVAQDAPKPDKPKKPAEGKLRRAYSFSFGGQGGYLGIHMSEITKENYSKYGLSSTRGVGVEKVLKDSAAEKAGLQKGDVIIGFNGEKVTSMRKLRRLISEVAPDHKISMTILRKGSEQELNATMGKRDTISFTSNAGRLSELAFPRMTVPVAPDAPACGFLSQEEPPRCSTDCPQAERSA